MVNDKNFATKYRPTTFSEVVGQDVAKTVLKKVAMAPGVSVRSIFLKGSWGSGKTTLSRIFGKALVCEHFRETGEVCNECEGCKSIDSPNSQNYMEFDSSVAGNVDAIRALQDRLTYLPKGRRLVVFDEIQAASKQALNALLKLVEEGIPDTIFLFASTDDILPTIKSRSLCIDISTIPFELIQNRLKEVCALENIEASDDDLMTIALKSQGHMRDALSILQLYSLVGREALASSYNFVVKFFKALALKRTDVLNSIIPSILDYNIVDIRNSINLFIRNCFIAEPDSPLYPFLQTGLIMKIYSFTFSPVSQAALKDEVGVEFYFRSLVEKMIK